MIKHLVLLIIKVVTGEVTEEVADEEAIEVATTRNRTKRVEVEAKAVATEGVVTTKMKTKEAEVIVVAAAETVSLTGSTLKTNNRINLINEDVAVVAVTISIIKEAIETSSRSESFSIVSVGTDKQTTPIPTS